MIKAIIADVDGVLVGSRSGVNFPLPNGQVIQKLSQIHTGGTNVVLCTAKFNYAVRGIVKKANLAGPHITDGGALILDPISGTVIRKHVIQSALARDIVKVSLLNNIYTEVYEAGDYFVETGQLGELTVKRLKVLQKEHKSIASLVEKLPDLEVVKIIVFAKDEADKARVAKVLEAYRSHISFVWTMHPSHMPFQLGIITAPGVSKQSATTEVLGHLGVGADEALGIGDTAGDWNFMQVCKYVATVGDASRELQDLARTKGEGNYYLAPGVDENGFLDVVSYFGIS